MADPTDSLYDAAQAQFLKRREAASWPRDNHAKFARLLDNLGTCRRLVDIGCGWGQFLQLAQRVVPEVWGVDESPHRLADIRQTCPAAHVVVCPADRLGLPDAYFDVAITSQMLHEVALFGAAGELPQVLREICRVLAPGGRYLLLDHMDAGEGEVVVRLPQNKIAEMGEFERKFTYYAATHTDMGDGLLRTSRRCLQDFLTKDWSLNSPMESLEMRETHNVFAEGTTRQAVAAAGFVVQRWIPFSDIQDDLRSVGGEWIEGTPWFRKFLLVAARA